MSMTIPTEAQNLLDAALAWRELDCGNTRGRLVEAVEAYRATQAKECRPPANAKEESNWFLTKGDEWIVREWSGAVWYAAGYDVGFTPADMAAWTVHSECRFGETGAEATPAAIRKIAEAVSEKHAKANYTAISQRIEEGINEAFTHFRAPKLEISDEEIDAIAYAAWVAPGSPSGIKEALRSVARAVIAKVGGEK